jgi:hypothetical protein
MLPCPLRPRCSKAKTGGRTLTIYPQEQYEALQRARERQKTKEFNVLYGGRAGIEGTISQSVRRMGLRRSRYIGLSSRICSMSPRQRWPLGTAAVHYRLVDHRPRVGRARAGRAKSDGAGCSPAQCFGRSGRGCAEFPRHEYTALRAGRRPNPAADPASNGKAT